MYKGKVPGFFRLFIASFIFSLISIAIAFRIFPEQAAVVAIFLATLGVMPSFLIVMESYKSATSETNDFRANFRLTKRILGIFVGVFLAFFICTITMPIGQLLKDFSIHLDSVITLTKPNYQPEHFLGILGNNLLVAVGVFFLSVLYRIGGATLVLSWNAAMWATIFSYFVGMQSMVEGTSFISASSFLVAVFPHTLLEAIAYIIAAIAGILLMRNFVRNTVCPETMKPVGILFAVAILFVIIGSIAETTWAPHALEWLS